MTTPKATPLASPVSPLVGLTGEARGVAFGVVIVAVGAVANVLAVFGLRERGEK